MNTQQLIEFSGNHPFLVMALAGILVMLLLFELQQRFSRIGNVSPAEATRLVNHENAILVDMRSDKDFKDGHIINAIHAPLTEGDIAVSLKKYQARPVVVYCMRGQRSAGYCNKLSKQGFEKVYNLQGGLLNWQKSELPVTKNT